MSVSAGAQKGNQNSAQSGVYSGITDSNNNTVQNQTGTVVNSGTTTGQTSGTQTGQTSGQTYGQQAGQTAGQNTVQTTQGWGDISSLLQGMVSGNGGLTPQQLRSMGIINDSAQNTANAIDYGGQVMSQYVGNNHDPYQIAAADKILAPTGASFMDAYKAPVDAAVNATQNDLTQGFKTALNEIRAGYGGAMGNGREGVAASGAANDFIRSLDNSASNLRLGAYNTQVGAGQGDAARQLQANTSNVDNGVKTDMFNVGQKNINDNLSMNAINQWTNNLLNKNSVLAGGAQANSGISQGGVGNLFNFLSSQNPAFGSSNTGTQYGVQSGNQSGTSSGTQSGTSSGTTDSTTQTTLENIVNSIIHGSSSGTSSGTSTGSSSSKGGGFSGSYIP